MLWKMTQHSFAGGRIDKELMGRQDLAAYFKGVSELKNFYVRRQGGVSKRRGTNLCCNFSALGNMTGCRLIPIVFSKDNGYYLLICKYQKSGDTAAKWYACLLSKSGVKLAAGGWSGTFAINTAYGVEMDIPAATNLNEIDYLQSGDTIYIVHKSFPPKRIVFNQSSLSLTIGNIPFNTQSYAAPTNIRVSKLGWESSSGASRTVRYIVSYVDENGIESPISDAGKISYSLPWPSEGRITVKFNITGYDPGENYHFNVYKKESSDYGLIGTCTADDMTGSGSSAYWTFTDDYITPDLTQTPVESKNHFNVNGEYPSTIALYQQRLVLCGTTNNPFTFYMSVTGDLYNFNVHKSMREDDAIEATLSASEMPEINHAVMSRDLILFTAGGEWEVAPVSGNTISYNTVSAKMQSAVGSARWTKPLLIGDEIIFVDGSGENLLATRYSYASDGYECKDLTIMSKWIFNNNGIERMCYKRSPDSSIICVLKNGEIASLAYMKEHDVCAWSRHVLVSGYLAKDVASSKAVSNGSTEVMLLVAASNNTGWRAWMVRDDMPVRNSPAVANYVCMDACFTVTVAAGTTYTVQTGYNAVNTQTAAVASGGSVLSAGTYVVGVPFESKLVTVHPEPQGNDTLQMEIKNATEVEARVVDGCSFTIGAYGSSAAHRRNVSLVPSASAGVISLKDANVRLPIGGMNNRDGRIEITQSYPFVFNLTSLSTTYQVEMANLNGGGNGNG